MKRTVIVVALTLLFGGVRVCLADSPQMGTWKLNEAKSKLGPGTTKNHTVAYTTAAGDNFKVTVDGIDAAGKPVHSEWTGKFDGKFYPVTGDPTSDTRSYKQINARTLALTAKQGNKVTLTGRIVVSTDGKTRTVTTNGADSKGKKVTSTAIYDKQ
ncbi:MAG TPA: hypothetical protein VNS63_02890 [Blastocatellia bacterium]|nr:hypothetical protein [Blastocatellia bacterium]